MKKKYNKKGFTLIEILAVIIILGILMIIAVPAVTKYIEGSKVDTYVDTIKSVVSDISTQANSGKIKMHDPKTTYYVPISCAKIENGDTATSPYGEFTEAYIAVNYKGTGEGFDYYLFGRDSEGIGVRKATHIDELTTDSIVEGVEDSEAAPNKGIDGRTKVKVFNSNCTDSESSANSILCKRATTLHTEKCSNACSSYGITNGTDIVYGNDPTTRVEGVLTPGDAFDCDVNGDGKYSAYGERFYYVSDYFDTNQRMFDDETATLVYYTNYTGAYTAYDSSGANNRGPITAMTQLPTTSQWSNVSLKNVSRQILSENGGNTVSAGVLPSLDYTGYAARLLTVQEAEEACGIKYGRYISGELRNCNYLVENTQYANGPQLSCLWFENPHSSYGTTAVYIPTGGMLFTYTGTSSNSSYGIHPAIDVPKSRIEY